MVNVYEVDKGTVYLMNSFNCKIIFDYIHNLELPYKPKLVELKRSD